LLAKAVCGSIKGLGGGFVAGYSFSVSSASVARRTWLMLGIRA
jgi:hypothetical protein